MSKYGFVHLHNHSEYSLLDGMIKVKDLAKHSAKLGMNAVALTDHGNLYGAIEFYQSCVGTGVKPIIGSEFYVTDNSRFDKSNIRDHLVLLAKSNLGYKNLIKLSSESYIDGFYYKPRLDRELIAKYSKDIICLSACIGGTIPRLIIEGKYDEAKEYAGFLREVYGADSFFIELQMHGIKEERIAIKELVRLAKEIKTPVVATNDAHYLNREDAEAHDVLLCIGTKKLLSDTNRMRFTGNEFYLKTEEEMERIFGELPKALSNTSFIADMCDIKLELPGPILPEFETPIGYDKTTYLKDLTYKALEVRYGQPGEQLKNRLDMELSVINQMGFAGYFLIVWDFIKYARDNGIWVGPGRGSGAGSIVAYVLGITNIEPTRYDLLFERFLNVERVSMPDFDIDFCQERRQEVIDYVTRKYTKDKVSQIVTFSKMWSKAVVKDVGRVLDIPLKRVDQISKMIVDGDDLKKEIEDVPELKDIYENGTDDEKRLLDISLKLEGLTRHTSVHAAGVVIGKENITEYVPLQIVKDEKNGDMVTTQFPGPLLEMCGLVKMDFLGLITLTLLRNSIELLKRKGVVIDIDNVPLDDPKVFELFAKAETDAVFQFESAGMQKYLKKLKPNCIEDLIAMNALYRPGPMDYIDSYIARKHGKEKVIYAHPLLETVLKETYGIMVYQEQVMRTAQVIAGYTLGSADILRRAMGKKKPEEMKKQKSIFIEGASKNNISETIAVEIFDTMEKFANYGFNKSHAAAYSYLAYQTAYIKAHYPVEFMCAVLTSEIKSQDKILGYIKGLAGLSIKLLPPDINLSFEEFAVEQNSIRYGFLGIKGVGGGAASSIVSVRAGVGKYESFFHFLQNVDLRVVNRAVIEILIKIGAFDSVNESRKSILDNLDGLIAEAQDLQNDRKIGQFGLFDSEPEDKPDNGVKQTVLEDWSLEEKLRLEREIIGFYISEHPLSGYRQFIKNHTTHNSRTINDIPFDEEKAYQKYPVTIAGVITSVDIRRGDRGEWAILQLVDLSGGFEGTLYNTQYIANKDMLIFDKPIVLKGNARNSGGKINFIVERITDLVEKRSNSLTEIHIFINEPLKAGDDLEGLRGEICSLEGDLSIYFHIKEGDGEKVIKSMLYKAPNNEKLYDEIKKKYQFISSIKLI